MKKSQDNIVAAFKVYADGLDTIPAIPGSFPDLNPTAAGFDEVLPPLLQTLPEVDPPKDLFAAIEAELDADPSSGIKTQRADEGKWVQRSEKIWKKTLSEDPATGRGMYLLRCLPGAVLGAHEHHQTEHIFVIEGDFWMDGKLYGAGDSQISAPGTVHSASTTPNGCLYLVYK